MALLTELCSFGNASPYHIDSVTNLRQPNPPLAAHGYIAGITLVVKITDILSTLRAADRLQTDGPWLVPA